MKQPTTEQIKQNTLDFYKAAFCVDGEVSLLSTHDFNTFKVIGVVKMEDSQRGTFYVGVLEKR